MTRMDCGKAREGLWPPERPRLAGEDVLAARAHVEECSACQAYFAQDRSLLATYDRIRRSRAPVKVRERVFDVLAETRLGAQGRKPEGAKAGDVRASILRWGGPALIAATLAALIWLPSEMSSPPDEGAVFVEDYLRRAVGQDHITTSDPAEIGRFLTRELGVRLRPLQVEGLELEGAEICLLEGRRGAMIVYKRDGAVLSHYLVPRSGAEARGPALSRTAVEQGDMPVVTWALPNVEQALVGEVPPDELLQLAEAAPSSD